MDGVSKVSSVASGPWTTVLSHVPVNSSLSQLTKHRMPLVLEDNRCVVHSSAAFYTPACCAHARVSLCCHSSKSAAVCDLSFMTSPSMKIPEYTCKTGQSSKKCTSRMHFIQHSQEPPSPPMQQCQQPQQPETGALSVARSHSWLPSLPLCLLLSPSQSCIFSSSCNWRSIQYMIDTGPRSWYLFPSLRANPSQRHSSGACGSIGVRSSVPAMVRKTETQWSPGCQVLLTVCLAQPAGFWSEESSG